MQQTQDNVGKNNAITGVFAHDLLAEQHLEQEQVTREISERISSLINQNQSGMFLVSGPMGAGKTGVSKNVATYVAERHPDRNIAFYGLNDGRALPEEVFDRGNTALSKKINVKLVEFGGIQAIFDDISNNILTVGSIVFLSEGQFFGNQQQLATLAEIAREHNIILCFDCLSSWYSGVPINETQYIATNLAKNNVWTLRACDSFASDSRADISMRCVILKEDGTYWEDAKEQESATYMNKKTPEEKLRIISIINSSSDPRVMRLKWWDSSINGYIYLIPSHPTQDASYVLGGDERYRPTSFETVINICNAIGLTDLEEAYVDIYQRYYYRQSDRTES